MRVASAAMARATIATHMLGPDSRSVLGEVILHAHQREAVGRVQRIIAEHGGALLADEVGLGKTYVALAAAAAIDSSTHTLVIGPAAVRDDWVASAARAGVTLAFHSMEALSGGRTPGFRPAFVIIDEAHHFRTPTTRRFAAAAELCAGARVLLLTATPVQNSERDLRMLLSLFLGGAAHAQGIAELARYIVRRTAAQVQHSVGHLPSVDAPVWLTDVDDADCLDRLLALPPAVPPSDGADAGILVIYSLVHQWSSSRAALRSALRRRLARGLAIADGLRVGRRPTRAELVAWNQEHDAQQLGFPELLAAPEPDAAALHAQIERHVDAVRELLRWLDTTSDPDLRRADALRGVLRRHPTERVVAFSEFAHTVAALFRLLVGTVRSAMITHEGGRIASGRIARSDIVARFATGAGPRAHERERIDLLLTTDVLSEGINLPGAGVVVHLDLAWNPARLEQRTGRLRRVDSTRQSIAVYLMPPPAPAERLLRVEERLRAKLTTARRVLGAAVPILPDAAAPPERSAGVSISERLATRLRGWRDAGFPAEAPVCATVRAPCAGAIACVRWNGGIQLVAVAPASVSQDMETIERLCAAAEGPDAVAPEEVFRETLETLHDFFRARGAAALLDPAAIHVARQRRAVLRRLDAMARTGSREQRARRAALVRRARASAAAEMPVGAERALAALAHADMSDDEWLRELGDFAGAHARRGDAAAGPEILAVVLLRPV